MASAQASRIVQLAKIISDSVPKIEEGLASNGLPPLSFDEDASLLKEVPKEISSARDAVIDAAGELHDLLLEPVHLLRRNSAINNAISLQAVARYDLANIVPLGGKISFAEIGEKTGLGEQMATRLVRYVMLFRVFHEPEPGFVAHTNVSKVMKSPPMNAWLKFGTEDMRPAAAMYLDAIDKWPGSAEPNETAYSLYHRSEKSIYDIVGADPEKAMRVGMSMSIFAETPDFAASNLVTCYDWASLTPTEENGRVKVVDIGGARGDIAKALALRFSNLEFLVQDMEKVIEGAEEQLPPQIAEEKRICFEAHDLFAPQTASANAYIFRWIFHNWGDKYCLLMLQEQIPALKAGARIIIMETILPDPTDKETKPVSGWMERDMRSQDMNMGYAFNGKERTLAEWKTLFAAADPRYVLKNIIQPEGSALSIMELVWSP